MRVIIKSIRPYFFLLTGLLALGFLIARSDGKTPPPERGAGVSIAHSPQQLASSPDSDTLLTGRSFAFDAIMAHPAPFTFLTPLALVLTFFGLACFRFSSDHVSRPREFPYFYFSFFRYLFGHHIAINAP